MSNGIEFSNEDITNSDSIIMTRKSVAHQDTSPVMYRFVRKIHLAKDDTQAKYVLLAFGIVLFIISGFVLAHYVFNIGASQKPIYDASPTVKARLPSDMQRSINLSQQKK